MAVITGASRGIGAAIAETLRDAGYRVVGLSGSGAAPEGVLGLACDVTDAQAIDRAFTEVEAQFGPVEVLVANAGITRDTLLMRMADDDWQDVIDVNLTGVFLCGREAAERMIKLGQGGVIINISSISRAGNAGQSNYSAAKAGVAAMATTWAKELARFGIRAGAIAPGFIKTDILSGMPPEMLAKMTAPVPLKRLGLAEEIAHTAVFMVENDFFTGRCIDVDGGLRL